MKVFTQKAAALLTAWMCLAVGMEASLNQTPRGLRLDQKETPREPAPPEAVEPEPVEVSPEPPAPPQPDASASQGPAPPESGTLCKWYGHGFIYLISESGVRISLNPFMRGVFDYDYPQGLPTDIVLISTEAADMAGGRDMGGLPQAFRSIAAVGSHSSHGIQFRGTRTYRNVEPGSRSGVNTVFSFEVDGIRFCHVGRLGHSLESGQRRSIGTADVVFLPIGYRTLDLDEWWEIARDLQAKWIVPLCLASDKSGTLPLRSWDDLGELRYPVTEWDESEVHFHRNRLPTEPRILKLQSP